MKKALKRVIEDKIKANEEDWASMYIVKKFQESQEKQDETEVAKAVLRMKEAEDRIKWLKELQKSESAE
jgi:hypothetical protein